MKANLATSVIAYARGGVRKQLLVLCLLTLCAGNMWGGASWIGKSYIVVNGTWYNADGTGQSKNFDGYNLGHLTSLTLGGEVQTYGQSDRYNNSATMGYQISGQSESSMTLYWYQYKENNNWFHSASGKSSDFAANTINISGLTPGEYTLSVWFYQADGGVYDSNSSNNYVATFYIDPTITFDQQSGTGGTSSITGTWGAAMPSIKLPSRAGKKFEGYYTGQNGTGTQYYAYNGNSVHTCDFTSNPTLYANWKTPTEYTFYYAAPSDIVADNTVKCYVNYGYDQGSADVNMTATNMTYNNKRIYSVTVTANYQSFDGIYFKPKGWLGDGSEEQAANTSYVAASEINGKIYEHGVGWQTYAKDASYTVYYVNTNNWTTPKAYAWSSDYDKSVADYASSAAMTKTDYTYNGHDIYTITYTRGFTNVIFNDNASESAKTGNLECYANRGKLYNGSTWQAFGRDITFYAVPESMDGSKWDEGSHTLYADIKYGDSEWKKVQMTKSAYDYNGNPIYTCMTLIPYNVIKQIKFYYNDGSDHDLYDCNPGTQYGTNDLDGKILLGLNGSHNWVSYGRDVTVYTVPEYLFRGYPIKFSEDEHYPSVCVQYGVGDGEWKTINMDKTDYTYDNSPIWKATFLLDYNIFKEFQIKYFNKANRQQEGLYAYNKGGSTEYPSSYLDDKLYHGWNGGEDHDFFSYRYDVALDMQSGGGGSTSIIAIDGSAMPSAKMPGRDGYAFGGYWTETNGGGTQYYNADGSSTRNWDSRTITTLYAHWTPKSYTVTLEGMEADSNDSVLVNVTYDAVLPELETKHTKAHYDLLGYWAASDDNGMNKTKQLIEANGKWIPDIAGYTGNDGKGNPTWKRDGIDISLFADWTEHSYTVTTVVSPAGAGTLSCGSSVTAKWVTLSEPITATASIGYSFREWDFSKTGEDNDVYSDSTEGYTSLSNPIRIRAQHDGTLTAKFTEIPTHITITKIGGGEVQINGEDKESTSVGVTTTRTLTAVAAAGYTFSGWTLPENADFEVIEGDVKNPTITLRGKGAGDAGEIVATFTECWVLSAQSEGWGRAEFTIANITVEDGKAIGYADIALPANRKLQFKMVDKSTSSEYKNGVDQVYYMTYGNSQNWLFTTAKTYNCGITTAGRGVYRFNWNFTDKTMTVVYPESYKVNYGAAVGGSVTSVLDDDKKVVPNGGYVRKGGSVTYEATASDGYTFTGWCPDDSYGDTFTNRNPWENSNVTATSNAYAKFHSTNFVIYRTDDKESDPREVWDDVESYEGGTISETIEFRMKVNKLDYWYTLCLPFEVNAVQVWEDGQYYDIVPYWRTGGTYYTGHYILRRPVTTTNFAIEGFEGKDRWIDPESSDVLPSKNIPYIIQWHDEYFQGKYISFFGRAGESIPTSMNQGANTSSDETVNIYGNNCMTSGTVRDAYMLDSDYGSGGAWLRAEVGTDRTVLPFECFIRANATTTDKYRVLRRDMADDTPTGLDTLSKTEDTVSKVLINNRIYIIRGGKMYTLQGTFVKEVE